MLPEQTIRKLNALKLFGMAQSFERRHNQPDHRDLTAEDFLGLLIDDETLYRQNKRQTRLLQAAHLKITNACLEGIDYEPPRGLMKSKVLALQNTEWIESHQNILMTGPTGVGKSYLACAFAQWACRQGCSTLYTRWPRLLGDMLAARGEGNYLKYLKKLTQVEVLVIDDFGLNALTESDRKDFMEIVEDRHMTASTIIVSQLPLSHWHEYIGDATIADAICDRLFQLANKFEMKGGSMRKQQKLDS